MSPDQARELLRRRVDAYSDEVSGRTMEVLDRLLALRESVGPATAPAVDAALDALIAACRKVAFDHSCYHDQPGPVPQPLLVAAPDQAAVDAVVDELDSLQRWLDQQAEWQDWVDAHNNAITYRQAATYVQHARVTLT